MSNEVKEKRTDYESLTESIRDNISEKWTVLYSMGILGIKSITLISWYVTLFFAASIAYTGNALKSLEKFSSVFIEAPLGLKQENILQGDESSTPLEYLYNYFSGRVPTNVLVDMLNVLVPDWSDTSLYMKATVADKSTKVSTQVQEKYYLLFLSLDNYLGSLVSKTDMDFSADQFEKNVIPAFFQQSVAEEDVLLPITVVNWIEEVRESNLQSDSKTNLVDTFLILIILGIFGSLIFLTKDLLSPEDENSILAYFFRPIFGMALAIAVFIVAILAHTLITTAPVQNIRTETMYILGLASGLLADTAYAYLQSKASEALILKTSKSKSEENSDKKT